MKTEYKGDKGISDIVGVFTDPILVFPGGWEDTLPDWLKTAIQTERLIMLMKALSGEEITGTDAEACAYLYTACLVQPVGHDWSQIYLYVANQAYKKWRSDKSGAGMPQDIRVDSLDDEQMRELCRLKSWIYQKRCQIRLDRDRVERRDKKEQEKTRQKELQPALFGF